MSDKDKLVGVQEAAEYLGIKPTTLSKWTRLNRGPKAYKINSAVVRYRLSKIDEWLEEGAE